MSVEESTIAPPPEGDEIPGPIHVEPKILQDWLSETETKRSLQKCIDGAIERLKNDTSLRVPLTLPEREDGFFRWLQTWKEKLGPAMQEQFAAEFPFIYQRLSEDYITQVVSQLVWPQVEPFLLNYAIRGVSCRWVSRHLGDAIILHKPERTPSGWVVRMGVQRHSGDVGKVVLDTNGEIDPDETSSRQEILACLRG